MSEVELDASLARYEEVTDWKRTAQAVMTAGKETYEWRMITFANGLQVEVNSWLDARAKLMFVPAASGKIISILPCVHVAQPRQEEEE
jgi:hypothetical protein